MQQIKKNQLKSSSKSPKRIGSSIKKDPIRAEDYLKYNLPYSCEECVHFKTSNQTCTLGFPTEPHLEKNQKKSYYLSGKMALCRFQEID